MQKEGYITIISDKKELELDVRTILYVSMKRNNAELHVSDGRVFLTRATMKNLIEKLGDGFILVHRSILVSVMAIHEVSDRIYLSNGEALYYVVRKKKAIREQLAEKQKKLIGSFANGNTPQTAEAYHDYYRSFDHLPFAFTDIEMVFDETRHAVDWIFRYANEELAKLEKLPLERLLGNSFGSLFSNMDSKWLRSYERATLCLFVPKGLTTGRKQI